MGQAQNLLKRLSNIFSKDPKSIFGQLMGSVGSQMDLIDPGQTNLAAQFAITTATGAALDKHGTDWGVTRRYNESDDAYRVRIQAVLPIYTNGPTVAAISTIVGNFTGFAPSIIEYGPMGFTMGVSPMGNFVFGGGNVFNFSVQVNNPNNIAYVRLDLEAAVNQAKPARSTAVFIHQGGV